MKKHWVVFLGVVLVACVLRFYRMDLLDLRFDEASGLQNARNVAEGQLLLTAPFSGSLVEHPPVYAYTMAIPYLFTRDFRIVAAFRILLDVAAVAGVWLLLARAYGPREATIAALCFAVAPWAVQFARKTWLAPLPVYHVLLLWGLIEIAQWKRPRGYAITGWGLALSAGAHLSALYLAPAVLVAAWIGRRCLRWKHALFGVLPLVILTGAWTAHAAATDFAELRAAFSASAVDASAARDPLAALSFAVQAAGGANLGSLTSGAFAQWQAGAPAWLGAVDALHTALLIAACALLIVRAARRDVIAIVLVAWGVGVIGAQMLSGRVLQPHYLLPLLPIPFVALGLLASAERRWLRTAMLVALIFIAQGHARSALHFISFVADHDTSNGGYGPPVRAALSITDAARARVHDSEAMEVIVVAPGGDPAVDEQAAIMDVLLADVPRRFVRAEDGLILRGDGAHYVFTPGAEDALMRLRESAAPEIMRAPVYAGDSRAYVAAVTPAFALRDFHALEAQWEGGARLIGYRELRVGSDLTVDVFVSVVGVPAGDVHWFARAYDGERQIASTDIGGVAPAMWRVGDVLALRFRLPVGDASIDRVRIGSYAYPEIRQLMLLDVAGNPVDDGVDLVMR